MNETSPVNFIFVVGGGALFGLLFVLGLIFYYSPETSYKPENVLLAPQVIEKLPQFDQIEFLYLNSDTNKWESKRLPLAVYGTFYEMVKGDVNEGSFDEVSPARIVINDFQQIEFSKEGNSYRAELKNQGEGPAWAYFTHEGILKKVISLFGVK